MSEIIGLCGDCLYSGWNKDLWYDENNVLHCRAYPDGVPEKVMKRLEKTGYCPCRNKCISEFE